MPARLGSEQIVASKTARTVLVLLVLTLLTLLPPQFTLSIKAADVTVERVYFDGAVNARPRSGRRELR